MRIFLKHPYARKNNNILAITEEVNSYFNIKNFIKGSESDLVFLYFF